MKLFGQLLIIGGQIVGKIVSSAYKQALASKHIIFMHVVLIFIEDAAKNPNLSNASSSSARGAMSVDEASKILNCPKNFSKEELVSVNHWLLRFWTIFWIL